VEWNTIGSIVAMVAHSKWDIFHLDVITTFLNGDLKEKVFMMQLERFFITGQETKMCQLTKILYGLKQVPKGLI